MNILLVEDEVLAAEHLKNMVLSLDQSINIIEEIDSVEDVVEFFKTGRTVDLLLLDIQLADGKSFEIFDKVNITAPIIFTTAYDQFAIQAFKLHSIDYLLKPIQRDDLGFALQKLKRMIAPRLFQNDEISLLRNLLNQKPAYRERFIIKSGNKLHFKSTEEIAYFYTDGKIVYLVSKKDNRKYMIDTSLDELERTIDPSRFFRINRKFIVCIDSIMEVKGLISTRLELKLHQPCEFDLSISRERASNFKKWLDH